MLLSFNRLLGMYVMLLAVHHASTEKLFEPFQKKKKKKKKKKRKKKNRFTGPKCILDWKTVSITSEFRQRLSETSFCKLRYAKYSRDSVDRPLIARLPRLFRTRSRVPTNHPIRF